MFGVLYLQSSYSMLKNTIPLKDLVLNAKNGGYDFVALSDENLHGMLHFFNEAKKHRLKAVLGLHILVELEFRETGFLVFVKNQEGYQNLLKLSLKSQENLLKFEDLKDCQKGLIFVTSGSDSVINYYINQDEIELASIQLQKFKSEIDELYIGLSLDTFDLEMKIAPKLYELSEHHHIKLLPIHQTSYLSPLDKEVYEALIKIDQDSNEVSKDANYAFLDSNELKQMFVDYDFVFDTLSHVMHQITFNWETPQFDMPIYPTPQGTQFEYLQSLAAVGLKKRLSKINNPNHHIYIERLKYELSVIHHMGFDNYFLIVYDFVKYAKTHDILVGPGRGSSAGSLVAYCLGITDVDPIVYDLLFERFLNPERISMPDIDLDFPDNKRDEVLNYVKEKYGQCHAVSIVTFGTFALRSSIRDIARVMKIDPTRVTGIIQSVVNNQIDETDQETMRLLYVAKKIEGLPRHTGTHAAGIILSEQDLSLSIPLQKGNNTFYQSQLEASDLESLGLLKIDFLGIRNLAVIDEVIKTINQNKKMITLTDISDEDSQTYELLSNAETSGIFQLESMGMRAVLRKLKPNTFEDIVAILALYRPGPMNHIDEYIQRRNGKAFDYLHPSLEPILSKTYGIIVYQEQIMKIASVFAGYSLAEADLLRRGISKKDKEILEAEQIRFIEKAVKNNHSKILAKEIYTYIVKFADYGFNRSHSVAYAIIAYQMAYLKANYFEIFMTILLSSVTGNEGLTKSYIDEINKKQVQILSPDINRSTDQYIFDGQSIIMPLTSIKSFGRLSVEKIMTERNQNGTYKNFQALKMRLKKELNSKNLEMLIHSGALDTLGINHQTMIKNSDMDNAGYEQYIDDYQIKMYDEYVFSTLVNLEKEALGFNLKYSLLKSFSKIMQDENLNTFKQLSQQEDVKVLAYMKKIKVIQTKQGKPMAFVLLDDGSDELETTLFTNDYLKYEKELDDEVKIYHIKLNTYQQKKTYVISSIQKIKRN